MKKFIFSFIVLIGFISNSQTNPLQEKYSSSERVYMTHLLFEDLLNCINKKFNSLNYEVEQNRLWLNERFGLSKKNASLFIEELEFSNLNIYESETGLSECDSLDKLTAINLLQNFEKIVSEKLIAENGLVFQYKDNPPLEYLDGYTKVFNTKGHPNAKSSDWTIKVPKSWKATEARNANVIQRFQNDFGLGEAMMLLTVEDIPNEFTKGVDLENEFKSNAIGFIKKGLGASKVTIVSFKKMNIAFLKGFLAVLDVETENLGVKMKFRQYCYQFFDDNYMYSFQGVLDITQSSKKIEDFDNLFFMCANSIMINQKQENIIYLNGTTNKKNILVEIANVQHNFLFDTGASISLISKNVINKLLEESIISTKNFLRKDYIQTADGKRHLVEFWNLPNLVVGGKKINDVNFAVMDGDIKPLLGMNIINKLNAYKIDLENNKIYLKD